MASTPIFVDQAAETGLVFHHFSGASGRYLFPEIMTSGVALVDIDNDNDLDVIFMQSEPLDENVDLSTNPDWKPGNRVFQNLLTENGQLRFRDISGSTGLELPGYGMGVASGDIDNDGDTDLYLTYFGDNALFSNNGDRTFTDITTASNSNDPRFSSSASFFDLNHDGLLDLFVAAYNNYTLPIHKGCRGPDGQLDYCDPTAFKPTSDRLFKNLGNSIYLDISSESGIAASFGNGLGVIAADLNMDGQSDVYVANDQTPNKLWLNNGDDTFSEEGLMSGTAYNIDGMVEASMGLLAGDIDGDGDDDLFMTHLKAQSNTVYLNDGKGNFRDSTARLNLGSDSLQYTGFGTVWIDFDNDSDLDIIVANGEVGRHGRSGDDRTSAYGQQNQLYQNDGSGRFTLINDIGGASFRRELISRGVAVGDIDNDGDLDAVISNTDGPAEVLINKSENDNSWLRLQLRGTRSSADGTGARVAIIRKDGGKIWRRAHSDGSYLSASDIRVHVGLGSESGITGVGIIWPSGTSEFWSDVTINAQTELTEGTGTDWMP